MNNIVVLASNNSGKIKEFTEMLGSVSFTVRPQREWDLVDADETGLTFVENALIKARHACQATGLPAIADDSGLVVDALNGAPGIYSARYAGPNADEFAYTQKLLNEMEGVPVEKRTARFVCVLAMMRHAEDPLPIISQATWEGSILTERRGNGGFGYDPVFYSPEENCAAAELPADRKHALSHRGKALRQLIEYLSHHEF
jgi:XTP/dITP diphosphohydrolase